MRFRILFTISAALIFLCSSTPPLRLALNLEVGKTYKQVMTTVSEINQDYSGQKIDLRISMTGSMSYRVKSASEKGYEFAVSYDSLSMDYNVKTGFPGSPKNELVRQMLDKIRNYEFFIMMDRNGKVLEIKGLNNLIDSMMRGVPNVSPEKLAEANNQFNQIFSEDAYKGSIEYLTAIYPDREVSVGDTWSCSSSPLSQIMMNMNYKLNSAAGDQFHISGNGKVSPGPGNKYIEANGMQIKMELRGNVLSEISLDASSGWIRKARIVQELNGETHIKENPSFPEGMHIPMKIFNEVTVGGK